MENHNLDDIQSMSDAPTLIFIFFILILSYISTLCERT
jgi:hypothetical protein